MTDRAIQPFLSIGEVLDLLQEEFADVTISKIRFLESQGLIDPERTPSGYRKFYEPDVERLRWILRQQKENFLPLKVIKGRLLHELADPTDDEAMTSSASEAKPAPASAPTGGGALDVGLTAASLTREELASASGLSIAQILDLERFGLLAGRSVAGQVYYDEEALVVARLAMAFPQGVEARHLRMYKIAAEREAGFYEQVVMPLMKQRNPTAKRHAQDKLAELARLGGAMRGAMLRAALRQFTD